ncbi:hypothetical protein CYMTET_48535, partial [Cymbomonas tetramitiformis]
MPGAVQYSPNMVGSRVRKKFPGHGEFDGECVSVDQKLGYHVLYSDGDAEDITHTELLKIKRAYEDYYKTVAAESATVQQTKRARDRAKMPSSKHRKTKERVDPRESATDILRKEINSPSREEAPALTLGNPAASDDAADEEDEGLDEEQEEEHLEELDREEEAASDEQRRKVNFVSKWEGEVVEAVLVGGKHESLLVPSAVSPLAWGSVEQWQAAGKWGSVEQ